ADSSAPPTWRPRPAAAARGAAAEEAAAAVATPEAVAAIAVVAAAGTVARPWAAAVAAIARAAQVATVAEAAGVVVRRAAALLAAVVPAGVADVRMRMLAKLPVLPVPEWATAEQRPRAAIAAGGAASRLAPTAFRLTVNENSGTRCRRNPPC
ncbi:MAG: hypothetical protein AVDCRST_MAG77-5477, partial [uncultured Chloroflexi bacterium]